MQSTDRKEKGVSILHKKEANKIEVYEVRGCPAEAQEQTSSNH